MRVVSAELGQADIKNFDSERMVSFLDKMGVNTVKAFALAYQGSEVFYQSRIAPPHPDMGKRDI